MTKGVLSLLASFLIVGCTTAENPNSQFTDAVQNLGPVKLTGWAHWTFEIQLFVDRAAMRHGTDMYGDAEQGHANLVDNTGFIVSDNTFPRCISGVFPGKINMYDYRKFDGRKVTAIGKIVDYRSLPDEDRPLIPRKVLEDQIIYNFCWGPNVLLLEKVELAER